MPAPRDAHHLLLRPFDRDHLALVEPWFENPEVRLRLGGPDWPARALVPATDLGEAEFRGRRVLREHTWLAWADGTPVGYLGGEVYDRWVRYDGSDPEHPSATHAEPGPAMGSAYVVDPSRWRRGYGTALLRAWVDAPEVADVRVFALGIEADNEASSRCALAAGFVPEPERPDWEDIVHHLWRR